MGGTLFTMAGTSARTIRTNIESRIATGELDTGDRLPSVRALAKELGVSPATVSSAYRDLRLRGMVTGRGRQGTVVAPARRNEPAIVDVLPAGLIDAATGSPDRNGIPSLAAGLAYAASLPQPAYGTELIAPELRQPAIAHLEADCIDGTYLAVTSGAMDAVQRVIAALDLRIGDRIGVEDPGHTPVHELARRWGLKLEPLAVDEHGIKPAGFRDALEKGLSAVVITPRAHNPTGAAINASRATALSKALRKYPATALILDDHAGLVAGVPFHTVEAPGPRWATIRSLGKSFGPDVRVALVAADQQTAHMVSTGISNGPGWVSFVMQRLAAFLLADDATQILVARTAASYEERRARLVTALAARGVEASAASGINVWIPTLHEPTAIEQARRAGFAIRGAASYRIASPPAVRATISNLTLSQIDELAIALSMSADSAVVAPSI